MVKDKPTIRHAFTLVEVMVTLMILVIPILVVGIVLADSHRSWNTLYNNMHSDVSEDGYVSVGMFERLIRKSSSNAVLLDEDEKWVEVHYYQDSDSAVPDRYAYFHVSDGSLLVEYGELNPKTSLYTRTVCENVSDCVFKQVGQSIQMILTLDDGTQTNSIVSSAIMHN